MEKIKDFLYYVGDFIVCILILLAMYLLITWKLEETMPVGTIDDEEVAIESVDEKKTPKDGKKESVLETGLEDNAEKQDRQAMGEAPPAPGEDSLTVPGEAGAKIPGEAQAKVPVEFTIDMGMTAQDIAKRLKENALIEDTEPFLQKLDEMKLSSSLLAGKFKLEKGMDYETMIKILAGRQ